jgi:CheY-like chemotaxis protein
MKTQERRMSEKPKVLLVDSDMEYSEQMKAALEGAGCEVVIILSGTDVLNKVRFEDPDVIILDTMLEKHDTGFIVAKTLKADPIYQRIPLIMVSSAKEKTGMDFSQELDGYWMKTNVFVNKPIEADRLVSLVKESLKAGKAA